jgi:hypothetical protein
MSNPITGLIDAIEDTVEHVFQPHPRERRHSHPSHHEEDCDEHGRPIVVNVNVGYCPPGSSGGPGGVGGPPYGGPGGAGGGQGNPPIGRPIHTTGTSDGSVSSGLGAPGAIIKIPSRPINVWPGPRTQLYLPFLFIRATAGDTAARPLSGTFWESIDILILPGVAPSAAPSLPPANLGGVAKAGADNTIYAHVWNLGQAPAHGALVEFYWFNPSLGFNGKAANLIGQTYVDLASRSSPGSHKLVKCPFSWVAAYENNGHECIVVRISQPCTDPLSNPAWDASQNRHIGQRNIHVMTAAEAAAKPTIGINVGPLFGQAAQVGVTRADAKTMPWLHLVTNSRTVLPATGAATGDVGITAPVPEGAGLPNLGATPDPRATGLIGDSHGVTGDGMQVGFVATDGNPGQGNVHVYRVSGSQNGNTFGGYTVVVLGS